MVDSINWVLSDKNFSLRNFLVEYLQFLGGDLAPHGLRMQENTDE